ncbi:MAG: trypsin-like peptidase domain-containing protein [Bryobacteraceae bacterium]
MVCRVTAGLVLVLSGAHFALAQKPGERNPLIQLSGSIRELTNRVSPAVVEILVMGYATSDDQRSQSATRISRQNSSGSGVIVDPEGYIMTNAHVVQGAVRVRVLIPTQTTAAPKADSASIPRTRSVDARVIGIDSESDLALIRIDESGLPALSLGDSDSLRQGDLVFAIGSPMGLSNSVSMGVVSAAARAVSDDNPILYIQTDASINPGNSGGALVDTRGMLIGLNTFIVSSSGGNQGLGFAIPSSVVRNVYEQLRHKGKVSRGSAGLFVQDISPVMAKGLGLPLQQGVVIADVEPNSPADVAGLKRRDIVLSLNTHVIETARQFEDDIYRRQGGEKISLVIQRAGQRLTVSAEVKEQSAPWDPLASLASPEKNLIPRLGILCIEIDKDVARLLPDLRRSYGIIVAAKASQGQAQFVDLQQGDIIHAVNNVPMALLSAFQETINSFKRGDAVVLQIERDGRFQYVAFEIE